LSLAVSGLAPQAVTTCIADYTVTQADIDAGEVTNVASASSGDINSPATSETVEARIEPSLGVTKSITQTVQAFGPLYDVTYQIIMENTGNVTLTNLVMEHRIILKAPAKTAMAMVSQTLKIMILQVIFSAKKMVLFLAVVVSQSRVHSVLTLPSAQLIILSSSRMDQTAITSST